MGLFRRGLTASQKGELSDISEGLNAVMEAWDGHYRAMRGEIEALYAAAASAQQRGLSSIPAGVSQLDRDNARESLVRFRAAILELRASFVDRTFVRAVSGDDEVVPDWVSTKFRKKYDDALGFKFGQLDRLDLPLEALSDPNPLQDSPGSFKLNMFVSGMNLFSHYSYPVRFKP